MNLIDYDYLKPRRENYTCLARKSPVLESYGMILKSICIVVCSIYFMLFRFLLIIAFCIAEFVIPLYFTDCSEGSGISIHG